MKRLVSNPHWLFLVGLALTILTATAVYFVLPVHHLLQGQFSIYLPGMAEPQQAISQDDFTNRDVLIKLTTYISAYWILFIILYWLIVRYSTIELISRPVKLHFGLTFLAFIFITVFNRYVTFFADPVISPVDLYVGDNFSSVSAVTMQRQLVLRDALTASAPMIGLTLLAIGTVFFVFNLTKSLKLSRQKES
jgi:hypothetical protein